jgi:hypothetical protein
LTAFILSDGPAPSFTHEDIARENAGAPRAGGLSRIVDAAARKDFDLRSRQVRQEGKLHCEARSPVFDGRKEGLKDRLKESPRGRTARRLRMLSITGRGVTPTLCALLPPGRLLVRQQPPFELCVALNRDTLSRAVESSNEH